MTEKGIYRIGTRGSALALVQTKLVEDALRERNPSLIFETKVITTKGDVNQAPIPLDTIGKAWFTEEIEEALLAGDIDLAVHSLKDLAPEMPSELVVLPVLVREDARDVLVSGSGSKLSELPQGVRVGTDSVRRKALLLELRPDLVVESIRGNIETRLHKLDEGGYDAIVIAAAGLKRLGLGSRITEYFDATKFIPAPGQGVLAAQCHRGAHDMIALLESIQDSETVHAVLAERAFSDTLGGGCKLPVGCYAVIEGNELTLHGMSAREDTTGVMRASLRGATKEAASLGRDLALKLQDMATTHG